MKQKFTHKGWFDMTTSINFSDKELEVLRSLALRHDLSVTQMVRQCLRMYQFIDTKKGSGYELAFTKDGKTYPMVSMFGPLAKDVGESYGVGENKPTEAFKYANEVVERDLMKAKKDGV